MHNGIHLQSNFCLAGVVRHKIDQQMRTVSVWDQLLKGLKGVLIQETFYGVEKGPITSKCCLNKAVFTGLGMVEGRRLGSVGESGPREPGGCCQAAKGARGLLSARLVKGSVSVSPFLFPLHMLRQCFRVRRTCWHWQYKDSYDRLLVAMRKTHRYQTLCSSLLYNTRQDLRALNHSRLLIMPDPKVLCKCSLHCVV